MKVIRQNLIQARSDQIKTHNKNKSLNKTTKK